MNDLPGEAVAPASDEPCLSHLLCDLIDATSELDGRPADRLQLWKEVIRISYKIAELAEPLLDREDALVTALREAEASRPARPASCPHCEKIEDGLCGRHACSDAVAQIFKDLGHLLRGPSYSTH